MTIALSLVLAIAIFMVFPFYVSLFFQKLCETLSHKGSLIN